MPPRTAKVITTDQHICSQSETIGSLKTAIELQSETDKRIEQSLKDLVEKQDDDRKEISAQFTKLDVAIATLCQSMDTSNASTKELMNRQDLMFDDQRKLLSQVGDFVNRVNYLQRQQDIMHEEVKEHVARDSAWKKSTEARLSKIERVKWFWTTLAIGIGSLLAIGASGISILYKLLK